MTSAALDACLCLLLVSAAAVTVTSVSAPSAVENTDRADAVAETLTATTAEVPYTLRPVPGSAEEPSPEFERVAHGTLVSLLADAAVRTVRVDGEALTGTNADFADAVRGTVSERLPPRTRVVVRWQPMPGSHLGRQFSVGPTPPPDADVHAETVRASSGIAAPAPSNASTAAQAGGYDSLARLVSLSLIDGLLPPDKGRLALGDDAPIDDLVRHRYRRVSEHYEVNTTKEIDRKQTRAANRRIAAAMADHVAADLRSATATPGDAAESLRIDTVEISVRTWSP